MSKRLKRLQNGFKNISKRLQNLVKRFQYILNRFILISNGFKKKLIFFPVYELSMIYYPRYLTLKKCKV
jgi:hypothetical protein